MTNKKPNKIYTALQMMEERERETDRRSMSSRVGQGGDVDVNVEVNAAKRTFECLNKRKKRLVAACSDFTLH